MNKTYRSVWNEAPGAWVATSELGGGRRKSAQRAAVSVDETPYLHVNSTATGNSTLANSGATGVESVAVGPAAIAAGANSVAVGSGAQANQASAIALGRNAWVTSGSSNAQSGGIAIGTGAQVTHNNVTLVDGTIVTPGGNLSSVAIGANARANYNRETIVGANAGLNGTRLLTPGQTVADIQNFGSDSAMFGTSAGQDSQYVYATFIGDEAGRGSAGQHNSFVGQNAGRWRDGSFNTSLGSNALVGTSAASHSVGSNNVATAWLPAAM